MYRNHEAIQQIYVACHAQEDEHSINHALAILHNPEVIFDVQPDQKGLEVLSAVIAHLDTYAPFSGREAVGFLLGSHVKAHVFREPSDLDWAIMLKESNQQKNLRTQLDDCDFLGYLAAALSERERLTYGKLANSFLATRGIDSCSFQSLYGLYPVPKLESATHATYVVELAIEQIQKRPELIGKVGFYLSLYLAPTTNQSLVDGQFQLLINALREKNHPDQNDELEVKKLLRSICDSIFFYYRIREKHLVPDWDLHQQKAYYNDDYQGDLPWTDLKKSDMALVSEWLREANAGVRAQVNEWLNSLLTNSAPSQA